MLKLSVGYFRILVGVDFKDLWESRHGKRGRMRVQRPKQLAKIDVPWRGNSG